MPADDSSTSVTIDQLVESFVGRLRAGELVSVESYQQQYPHLADEIGVVFPPLQMLENCRPAEEPPHVAFTADVDDAPARLGDYRIIQEIGRGGMGIVYEAEHDAMRRRVALKVLPKTIAERSSHLARFQLEARSAGQMHHTNIVPVFEVGEDNGYHFYAMQFIRGQSLELVIEEMHHLRSNSGLSAPKDQHELEATSANGEQSSATVERTLAHRMVADEPVRSARPVSSEAQRETNVTRDSGNVFDSSEWSDGAKGRSTFIRRVAAIGMQVADALAYAHHNQVLHRDIKPANLLLDTDGTVWVTDFGLAKGADDDLTQTGDIVGTLRYMAPERFQGRTDALCDIYGLGLTLYELCTLTAAFRSSTRASLIDQITHHDPPAPRSIDPTIPRDLETIILKAIDRIPERRYQSAMLMAEDLQAFLADRPVRARRISPIERLWRVCRRNPVTAMLTAASLALLVTITAGLSYFSLRLSQQSEALRTENKRAIAAEREARQAAYDASVGEAQSLRQGRLPGQHFDAIAAVKRAATNLEHLQMSAEERRLELFKLRTEATAALSLTDLSHSHDFGQATSRFWSLSVSNDRKLYAQPNDLGEVVIATLNGDEEVTRLPAIDDQVWVTRFGPDAKHLTAIYHSDPNRLVVWRLADGERLHEFSHPALNKFACYPNGGIVTAVEGELLIFGGGEVEDERTIKLGSDDERITCRTMGAHPTRSIVALGLDVYRQNSSEDTQEGGTVQTIGRVSLVDIENDSIVKLPVSELIGAVAWVSDDVLAIGYQAGSCELRNVEHPEVVLQQFHGHTARVTNIRVSHDGRVVMTKAWDGSMRVWDALSGRQLTRINGFELIATSNTRFDDRLLLWRNRTPQLWSVHRGQVLRKENLDPPHTGTSNHIAAAHPRIPNLAIVATKEGYAIRDLANHTQVGQLHRGRPTGLGWVENGEALMTATETGIEWWPVEIDRAEAMRNVRLGPPELVAEGSRGKTAFHDKYTWASLSQTDRAHIYNRHADAPFEVEHYRLSSLRISADGKWLATQAWHGGGIRIWDIQTAELVADLIPESISPRCGFTPDSQHLVINARRKRYVFRTNDWKMLHELDRDEPDGWPGRVITANDNRTVALNHSRYRIELFDLVDGHSIVVLEPSEISPRDPGCFSSDGASLLTFHKIGLEVWNLDQLRSRLAAMELDWQPAPKHDQVQHAPLTVTIVEADQSGDR